MNDLLIFLALITLYEYPPIRERVSKLMKDKVFTLEHRNPDFREPLVKTVAQVQRDKMADMNRFKQRIKDGLTVMQTLKKIKIWLAQLTIRLMDAANFFEKSKNLVCWADERRTFYFFLSIIFTFCALNAFTLRFLILLGSTSFVDTA